MMWFERISLIFIRPKSLKMIVFAICAFFRRPMQGWQVAASPTLWIWRLSNGSKPWRKQVGRCWQCKGGDVSFSFSFLISSFVSFCCLLFFSPPIRFCLLNIPASFPSSVFEACNRERNSCPLMSKHHCYVPTAFSLFCFPVSHFFGREVFCF